MLRRLVLALVLLVVAPVPGAKAQCSRIGEQVCQGGFLYTCQACGSEKCLIFSSEPCQVPVDSLAGTWSGSGHQSGAAGHRKTIRWSCTSRRAEQQSTTRRSAAAAR